MTTYLNDKSISERAGGLLVQPSGDELPIEELEKLLRSDNEIVLTIKTKLKKLELASDQRTDLITQSVRGYIVGKYELQILNEKFPSTYESVVQLKSATESQLPILMLSCSDNHGTILHKILQEYEGKLSTDFSGSLSSALIKRLSTEAISDWLVICSLNVFSNLGGNDENY